VVHCYLLNGYHDACEPALQGRLTHTVAASAQHGIQLGLAIAGYHVGGGAGQ
jgi:hypothetical protein